VTTARCYEDFAARNGWVLRWSAAFMTTQLAIAVCMQRLVSKAQARSTSAPSHLPYDRQARCHGRSRPSMVIGCEERLIARQQEMTCIRSIHLAEEEFRHV